MRHPFPGMNPYLEHPVLWPDVHLRLVVHLAENLVAKVAPPYFVPVEERRYVEPAAFGLVRDDETRETFLEVTHAKSRELVTVIEVLSPTNKRQGAGRRVYEDKRRRVLGSRAHLVEIDLLRAGESMTVHGAARTGDYCIMVSRGDRRPSTTMHPFGVRDPIPVFAIPLRKGDTEPELDVGEALQDVYDRARYDLRIDYRADPVPPLAEADRGWAREVLGRGRADPR